VLPTGDVLVERRHRRHRSVALEADAETIDCAGHFVLPGLINAHMHTWQTALRSVAANWTLLEYFRQVHAGPPRCSCRKTSTSPPWPAR
jgi:cytosine/adenosine deaminase-related metal-dependent hydrolase